jgi:hypothetical protein
LISIGFGIALFFVYLAILPHLDGINDRMLTMMTITGHALFIFVGFSYPGLQACGHDNPTCAAIIDQVSMLAVCGILLIYYFGIGALIGVIAQKVSERKQ